MDPVFRCLEARARSNAPKQCPEAMPRSNAWYAREKKFVSGDITHVGVHVTSMRVVETHPWLAISFKPM
ncbi:hypothetical protein IL60_0206850 [Brucella inopinata BO1]|nr:hypothetical protein IL60_0206850 [Brucella inopinata BO1]